MPTIRKLYDHFRDDPSISFVIASRLDFPERVRWYARYFGYRMPSCTVRGTGNPNSMKFNQYPATLILGQDGSLVKTQIGGADWNSPAVADFLRQLEKRRPRQNGDCSGS
jgi:hypothetical protein